MDEEEWMLKPKTDYEVKFLQIFKLAQQHNVNPFELSAIYAIEGLATMLTTGLLGSIGKNDFKELYKSIASLDLPMSDEHAERFVERILAAREYMMNLRVKKESDDE